MTAPIIKLATSREKPAAIHDMELLLREGDRFTLEEHMARANHAYAMHVELASNGFGEDREYMARLRANSVRWAPFYPLIEARHGVVGRFLFGGAG